MMASDVREARVAGELRRGWVSVVIPAYNRADRVAASVASCLEQTHEEVEVIVVDDGSTDGTPDVLTSLERTWGAERFRWVRQANQGAPAARNAGMALATGEYLQLHDSDDVLSPEKFEVQLAALKRTGADCALSDLLLVADDAAHTPIREVVYDRDLRVATAHYKHAHIATLLMRRRSLPEALRWNTALTRFQDVDFVVRYFLSIRQIVHTPGFFVLDVRHEGPQISEIDADGHQNRAMFEGLMAYWRAAGRAIPEINQPLVRRAALTLAWRSVIDGQGEDARAILRFAALGPEALRRAPRAGATALLSAVPFPVLRVARDGRRWVRARIDPQGG